MYNHLVEYESHESNYYAIINYHGKMIKHVLTSWKK